jgi:hypothetical protein
MAECLARVDEDGTTEPAGPELAGAQTSTAPTRWRGEPDGRQELPELEARWPARKTTPSPIFLFSFSFFHLSFFLIGLTSGPFYPCQQAYFLFAHLHLGRTHQIWCQFALNLRSVRIANNYPKSCGFLRLKRKVVIFQNLAFNVVVLY